MGKAGNPNWLPGISGNPGGRSRELAQQQSAARLEAAGHALEVIAYLLKVLRSEEEGTAQSAKCPLDELRQLEERLAGSFTSAVPLLLEGQRVDKQPDGSDG